MPQHELSRVVAAATEGALLLVDKLTESDDGDSVLVVSMHPPERSARNRRRR